MILVFLALLFILKFNSPSVYIDYLIGLVLVLCLASVAFTVWVRFNIHLEVDSHAGYLHEGDELNITVRVVSPELCGKLRAVVEMNNLQRHETAREKRWLTEHRCELSFSGSRTGTIKVTVPYVEIYGVFGIFCLRKRDVFEKRINIYPNAGPSPDRHVRLSYIHGGGEIQNAKGDDYSEIYEVRPMQEGDDLRHVHRQLSAKYDEYIIKVGSDSRRPVYSYFVDEGRAFPEMSDSVAQMITLKKNVEREEGAVMAAAYRGKYHQIAFDHQLYALADLIYEDCLPERERVREKSR